MRQGERYDERANRADAFDASHAPETSHSSQAAHAPKPASKLGDLRTRIISGAVYVVCFVVCLLAGKVATAIFLAAVSGVASFEFFRMMRVSGAQPLDVVGMTFSVLYPIAALVGGQTLMNGATFVLVAVLLLIFVIQPRMRVMDISITLFGSVYTGLMLSSFVLIEGGIGGLSGGVVCLIIYASVVMNDSFAYLVGSRFGKHKLVPHISPKKSWEGFAGGVVASALTWLLMLLVTKVTFSWYEVLILGAVCGIVGVLGDLAESRVKRGAGVKDSGTIMPGHGGILDRIDSLILVSFVAYLLFQLVGII